MEAGEAGRGDDVVDTAGRRISGGARDPLRLFLGDDECLRAFQISRLAFSPFHQHRHRHLRLRMAFCMDSPGYFAAILA